MNEIVEIPQIDIKGEVLIELFDKDGNKIHEEHGFNTKKDLVNKHIRRVFGTVAGNWTGLKSLKLSTSPYDQQDLTRFVYLINEADAYDPADLPLTINATSKPAFPLFDRAKSFIGYVDKLNQTIGADSKIGITNIDQTYNTDLKSVQVFQWGQDKAVGTFDTIIHSRLDTASVNSLDAQEYFIEGETVLKLGKPFNQNVLSSNYCVFEKSSELYVAQDPKIIGGTNLQIEIVRLSTNTSEFITIPTWDTRSGHGTAPQKIGCYCDGASKYVWALDYGTNYGVIAISADNNSTFSVYKVTNIAFYYGTSFDDTYVYIKPYNNSALYRFNHTTAGAEGESPATEYVTTRAMYSMVVGNFEYDCNTHGYFDLTGANWETHDTLTEQQHKFGYPDINNRSERVFNGYYYANLTLYNWYPGYPYGNHGVETFCRFPIEQYKEVESFHYKLSTPISKGASETLKITYTYNVS